MLKDVLDIYQKKANNVEGQIVYLLSYLVC